MWSPSGMRFILWIDDEPLRFNTLGHVDNAVVIFAHGFDQVKHYLHDSQIAWEHGWDLIILDHDMPMMDGMSVCETFLFEKNIPVILCSMNPDGRARQLDFLRKYDDEDYQYPVYDIEVARNDFRVRVLEVLNA